MGKSQGNKEENYFSAMQDYAKTLTEYVQNPVIQNNDLPKINGKVSEFFRLMDDTALQELDKSELSQLSSMISKFHKAVKKRSQKSMEGVKMAEMTTVKKQETQANAVAAVTKSAEQAESAWKNLVRPSGTVSKVTTLFRGEHFHKASEVVNYIKDLNKKGAMKVTEGQSKAYGGISLSTERKYSESFTSGTFVGEKYGLLFEIDPNKITYSMSPQEPYSTLQVRAPEVPVKAIKTTTLFIEDQAPILFEGIPNADTIKRHLH